MPARPDSLPAAGWKGSKGHPSCASFASGPLLESSDERSAFRVANRATARFVLRTGGAGSKGLRHSAIHPENRRCRFEGACATARFVLRTGSAGSKGLLYTAIQNTRAKLVRRNQHKSSPNFVQLVLVLYQFCTNAQLFPPRLRATFEWKLNYETTHKITAFWAAPEPAGAYRGRISIFELRLCGRDLCIINR